MKIDDPFRAYVASGFLSTAIVAGGCACVAFGNVALHHPGNFDLIEFVVGGVGAWLFASILGLLIAWPFVAAATWTGQRLRIESPLYYPLAGGLVMSAFLLLLIGVPRHTAPSDFGMGPTFMWAIGVTCGVSFGACWWVLHRRWKRAETGI